MRFAPGTIFWSDPVRSAIVNGFAWGIVAGLLLCFCLVARAGERIRAVLIFKGKLGNLTLAQPVFAPRFILERVKGDADPVRGMSCDCRAFRRTLRVVEMDGKPGIVQDMALDCDGTIFVIKGLIFDPPRD